MWVYWLVNFSCLSFPNAKCATLSWPLPYAISMQISNADWGILVLIIIGREPYRDSCMSEDLAKYFLESGCMLAVVRCRSYRDLALALKQRINTLKKEALHYLWLLLILRAVEILLFMQGNLVSILFYCSPHHLTNLLALKPTMFLRKHLLLLPSSPLVILCLDNLESGLTQDAKERGNHLSPLLHPVITLELYLPSLLLNE